jgi:hypothetical protein
MRAFQSQVVFGQGFWEGGRALLVFGHFRNVQNRFASFKPRKFLSIGFYNILLKIEIPFIYNIHANQRK